MVGFIMRDMIVVVRNNSTNINPTIAAVANNQTINNSDLIRIRPGSTLSLQLTGTDANASDAVQLTTDATSKLPGATLTPSAAGNHAGTIDWTVPASAVLDKPYYFTVKVTDNACPLMGFETRSLGVVVSNSGTPTGISELQKGTQSFIAYPNPFQDAVTFKLNLQATGNQTLIIYNTLGQLVDEIDLKGEAAGLQEITWGKCSKMAKGQYTAKLVNESQVSQTIKFSKL